MSLIVLQVKREATDDSQDGSDPSSPTNRDWAGGQDHPSPGAGETCGHGTSEVLLNELYHDLRKMAAGKMARELAVQTLQPTALVHEAWLKLGDQKFENQAHFFGAAAEAMRRILVDRARKRGRQKRGGGSVHADYEESQIAAPMKDEQLLEIHEALDRYAGEDPIKAEVVKLRFFAGLTHSEVANLLSVSEKTARRHWQIAKIRLFQLISEG